VLKKPIEVILPYGFLMDKEIGGLCLSFAISLIWPRPSKVESETKFFQNSQKVLRKNKEVKLGMRSHCSLVAIKLSFLPLTMQSQTFTDGWGGGVQEGETGLKGTRTFSMLAPADFTDSGYRDLIKIFPKREMQNFVGGNFRITGDFYSPKTEVDSYCFAVNDLHWPAFFITG
jgi:hypothetical protein